MRCKKRGFWPNSRGKLGLPGIIYNKKTGFVHPYSICLDLPLLSKHRLNYFPIKSSIQQT